MTKHHLDYFWKDGLPCGLSAVMTHPPAGLTYKLVSDPYHKRNSIEKYLHGDFVEVVYDSALFDFRHLKPALQTTWQKTTISETAQSMVCHIRNQDDRLILVEEYHFENNLCRQCRASSPHGSLLSVQKIFYEALNDPFNGVVLYDSNAHAVICKRYLWDSTTHEFSELTEELWDMSKAHKYTVKT